jgi:WD repeat-containing protein 19
MSKNLETAFVVASQNDQVQLFADILGDQAQSEDYNKIAGYYDHQRNFLLAGKYYALAGQNNKVFLTTTDLLYSIEIKNFHLISFNFEFKAFKFFIKAALNGGDEEKAINAAIHIVSTSKDDQLAAQLIAFLNGEQDNIPKVLYFFYYKCCAQQINLYFLNSY